jgi:hypothetical protein
MLARGAECREPAVTVAHRTGSVPRPGLLYGLLGTTRSMGSLTTFITRLRK